MDSRSTQQLGQRPTVFRGSDASLMPLGLLQVKSLISGIWRASARLGRHRMQTRIAKIEPVSICAAEAARMVGLRNAAEFRLNFGAIVKPLPLPAAEVYSIEAIKRAVAALAGTAAARQDSAWLEEQALRRLDE